MAYASCQWRSKPILIYYLNCWTDSITCSWRYINACIDERQCWIQHLWWFLKCRAGIERFNESRPFSLSVKYAYIHTWEVFFGMGNVSKWLLSKCSESGTFFFCLSRVAGLKRRFFFIAGILSKHMRSNMSLERLDEMLNINSYIPDPLSVLTIAVCDVSGGKSCVRDVAKLILSMGNWWQRTCFPRMRL